MTIHQRHRRTTCDRKTMLCTTVHLTVKINKMKNAMHIYLISHTCICFVTDTRLCLRRNGVRGAVATRILIWWFRHHWYRQLLELRVIISRVIALLDLCMWSSLRRWLCPESEKNSYLQYVYKLAGQLLCLSLPPSKMLIATVCQRLSFYINV